MKIERTSDRDPSRYCTYCGVFNGMPHSPDCPEGSSGDGTDQNISISIPPEVMQYAPEISRFVEAMVYKLGVHSGKGKWENQSIESRLPKLDGEVEELRQAVQRGNMVEILLEAADVANYALIIATKGMER